MEVLDQRRFTGRDRAQHTLSQKHLNFLVQSKKENDMKDFRESLTGEPHTQID